MALWKRASVSEHRARLNVLFVTTWYPTREQPVSRVFVREHARAVSLFNNVVVLHCVGPDPNLRGLYRMEEERDPAFTEGVPTFRLWWWLSPVPKTSYLIYLWAVWRAVEQMMRGGFRPDVLHAHTYEASVPAVLVAKLWRLPVLATEHWSGFPRRRISHFDVGKARWAFERADLVMPVSRALQRGIQDYGIAARFRIVPNVVDPRLFFPAPEGRPRGSIKQLLFVGALEATHVKGVPYLLEAVARLRRERDDWRLLIVGDGPMRRAYEGMAVGLGLSALVSFAGERPKAEIARMLRGSDLFVLPSVWENQPCVALEAMASGVPIVTTRAGGIPEIVDDEVGLLVPPADAKALAAALSFMLDHALEYPTERIVRRATERFTPEKVGARLDAIYRDVV